MALESNRLTRLRLFVTATALAVLCSIAVPAHAQYFGRNKVQYKDFTFEVIKTAHFQIYFYPEEREGATELARMAERWYTRLSRIFGYDLSTPQPIVVYASAPDFRQTNVISGDIGEGTGGVTEGAKRRIVMPLAGTLAETDHVLGHELVHAFQYDMGRSDPQHQAAGSGIEHLPLWFIEGMAEYLSIGHVDAHTAMWIRDAAREGGKMPAIGQLNDPRYFPYRWGQALWSFVAGRWGDAAVERAFTEAVRARNAEVGLELVTGLKIKDLSQQWHEAILAQHAPILRAKSPASVAGRLITPDQRNPRSLALSPVLSPDGTRVVYLSERDMLSIDLYLADTATGEIIRKLVNTAIDPHYSSIQFISSAGTFDPKGNQFAFGAISQGKPALAIIDIDRGDRVRDIPFPALGEILNPSWSPDGRTIAFSATTAGRSDLYLYDLTKGTLRQLTNDAYADVQPAWSPRGDRLAFVTDRFTTDLASLDAGRLELAVIDLTSERIEVVPTFATGKNINPQWAADGERVYFLSDASGLTNIYAVHVGTQRVTRLTDLDAGTSGITALSPAMSASADSNRLAFSAYEGGRVGLYLLEGREALIGTPLPESATETTAATAPRTAAILPPGNRVGSELMAMLNDAMSGLPATVAESEPYDADLSLDAVGQPYVTAGVSRFGGMFGGGLAFSLSDMLGNHNLYAAVNVNSMGGFSDIYKNTAAQLAYTNLSNRWNWGLSVGQVPYLTGGYAQGLTTVNGQQALVEQEIIYRQTHRGVDGQVAYPFSETHRLEVGGGFRQVSYDQQVRTVISSLRTGERLSNTTETTALFDTLNLTSASVASVYDTSILGPTSPVNGQRSRFEVTPTTGSLTYTGALADYRRYFMPKPFYTIAGRIMHYGRYGNDGENSVLLPLYLGYPELIRGYNMTSFRTSECAIGPSGPCEVFDRLQGSRMLVANLEFRFPLLRPFGVTNNMYGPMPVEVALFADAGTAWTADSRPTFFGGHREPVTSAGVTFRTNLFGFAVGQLDFAYPFQRPGRGWVWSFSLVPGF